MIDLLIVMAILCLFRYRKHGSLLLLIAYLCHSGYAYVAADVAPADEFFFFVALLAYAEAFGFILLAGNCVQLTCSACAMLMVAAICFLEACAVSSLHLSTLALSDLGYSHNQIIDIINLDPLYAHYEALMAIGAILKIMLVGWHERVGNYLNSNSVVRHHHSH